VLAGPGLQSLFGAWKKLWDYWIDFPLAAFPCVAQIWKVEPQTIMERHPFTVRERMTLRSLVRVMLFVVGYLVILFVIGRETAGLTTIVLMFASFFAFFMLYILMTQRRRALELLTSPCPKCGHGPMRFEPSSEGDYAFICDKCQIEWTLNVPPSRHQ
jgi:hypothetical protein